MNPAEVMAWVGMVASFFAAHVHGKFFVILWRGENHRWPTFLHGMLSFIWLVLAAGLAITGLNGGGPHPLVGPAVLRPGVVMVAVLEGVLWRQRMEGNT